VSAALTHFQRLVARADEANIPLAVQLELTGRCPLRCRHCYLPAGTSAELPTAAWLALVDELAELGTLFVSVTGGEPLLREDALAIVGRARERGLGVTLLTSGTVGTPATTARIAALGLLNVDVSLYSHRAAAHDAITGVPGSFRRTLAFVRALRRRAVRVRVKAPLLETTARDLRGIVRLASRLGATPSFDPTITVCRDGGVAPRALRPTREALVRALVTLAPLPGGALAPAPPRAQDEPVCSAGRRVATVLPNGDVLPCSLWPEPAGNLRQTHFADIWRSSPLLERLRRARVGDLDPRCARCPSNGFCGRCGALALLEEGDWRGPSRVGCDLAEAAKRANELMSRAPCVRRRMGAEVTAP
jgi:radical SAM protein with 4Fe4S-binding SPASM domain